jgi:hypothetical protein
MIGNIRIIKHEAVPMCRSFQVRLSDGRQSRFFYWDDVPGRRTRRELLASEEALERARVFARPERDKDGI